MSPATLETTLLHPARPGPRPMNAEDLWAVPRVGPPVFAPDASSLAVPVTTFDLEKNEGRGRIWLVPADGGPARALTAPEHSSAGPAFSPDGRTLAFVRKVNGRSQLFLMPLDGGEARQVTDLPLGVYDPRWLPDGSGVVCVAPLLKGHLSPEATRAERERREKDPVKAHVTEDRVYRYWDTWLTLGEVPHLFLIDAASAAPRDLTPDSTAWFDWLEPAGRYDLAPDGREVAFEGILFDAERSVLRSAIFTAPVAGGAMACLTRDHPSNDLRPRYSPDGRWLAYGMQHDPFFYADRVRLMRLDRGTGEHQEWLSHWALSPDAWEFLPDGSLALLAEQDARVAVFAWAGRGEPRVVARGGSAAGLAVGRDARLAFTLQTLAAPAEVHACAPDGAGLVRLSRFTDEATAAFATGEVREAWFEGAAGERVHLFLVFPPGEAAQGPRPLVQVVHGGPHGISPEAFHPRWNAQLFAAPGYLVAMVNFQGSTSWGQDFAKRIQGAWAERPFEDVMRATDLLVAAGLADPARLAAAGGSYGGYLVSWIEGHTDRFRCLVNHAGVYDTLAQYASDVTQGRHKSFGGEPWDGLEAIHACSPANHARGFRTPMLVIHGERDFRVPAAQGLECYGVLKAKGVPSRLVYFPDENHWILKPRNSLLWWSEVHAWLARWMG
jgi:dipeptidyl aminopeptidase/acylaminoacyl peptidase